MTKQELQTVIDAVTQSLSAIERARGSRESSIKPGMTGTIDAHGNLDLREASAGNNAEEEKRFAELENAARRLGLSEAGARAFAAGGRPPSYR